MTHSRIALRGLAAAAVLVFLPRSTAAENPPAPPLDELPAAVKVTRAAFGTMDPAARRNRVKISRDFGSVLVREEAPEGERVVLDGVAGPRFKSIYSMDFAPAGRRWSYEARLADGKNAVVLDGVQGPAFETAEDVYWSADGKHCIYRAKRAEDGAWAVVRDGVPGEFQPGRIATLAISPDGAHAVVVREDANGKARLAELDGKPLEPGASGFSYSPFRWSANGAVFAYVADRVKGEVTERFLVVDGVERAAGRSIDPDAIILSKDGKHFAANVSGTTEGEFVVHDGRRYGPYKSLWNKPVLSPDGTRVAFSATLDDGFAHLVTDGVAGPAAINRYGVRAIRFSADGRTLAFVREVAEKEVAVHVGDRVAFKGSVGSGLWLSPDGSRAAWLARTPKGMQVMVEGGGSEQEFREVAEDGAQFTPDGRDFIYVATRDRKSFTLCVAGVGRRTYELAAPLFQFGQPGEFTFVTFEAGTFYRETWQLPR